MNLLKRAIKAAIGNDLFVIADIDYRTERLGTEYGGWDVAIDCVESGSIVYSFGIGEDLSFDIALMERKGCRVHAFDPTPRSLEWVDKADLPEGLKVHECGLSDFDGYAPFYSPDDPGHVSRTILDRSETDSKSISLPVRRLSTIMNELGHQSIDLLKMDIEGAEYRVIEDIHSSGIRPGQILVEFHHQFPDIGTDATKKAINMLKEIGYRIFSVSGTGREFGFILQGDDGEWCLRY